MFITIKGQASADTDKIRDTDIYINTDNFIYLFNFFYYIELNQLKEEMFTSQLAEIKHFYIYVHFK